MDHLAPAVAAEVRAIRALAQVAHAQLNAANARGATSADLSVYSDAMAEIVAREKDLHAAAFPSALDVHVSFLSDRPQLVVWRDSRHADTFAADVDDCAADQSNAQTGAGQ